MKTLSPTLGSNLKEIRKFLNLKQSDISGDELTRNLISLIENNKTPINTKNASIIVSNINTIMAKRHSSARTTLEDLLTIGLFKAKRDADSYTKELNTQGDDIHFNLKKYLNKMNAFYAKWDLPEKKYQNYYLLGEYFQSSHQLDKSNLYFTRAYENAVRLENKDCLGKVAVRLTSIALILKNYESAITLSKVLKNYDKQIKNEYLIETSINESSAFRYLHNYEEAIDALLRAEHYVNSSTEILNIDLQLLKADLYIEKGMLGIAGRILKTMSLRSNIASDHIKLYIQSGILLLNLKSNNIDEAKSLFIKITSILNTIDNQHKFIPEIYAKLGDACLILTNTRDYLHYMNYTLSFYNDSKDMAKFIFYLNRIITVFSSGIEFKFEDFENIVRKYMDSHGLKKDTETQLKLIKICLSHNSLKLAQDILKNTSL